MNPIFTWLVLFNYLLLVHFYPFCEGVRIIGGNHAASRTRHRPSVSTACPMPKLKNGTVRMQRGGRMGYFFCANGFDIHGPMNIVCQMGRWKQEIPKCLRSGCKLPQARSNGYVMIDEKKQQAMLFCQDGYLSAGSTNTYCDGVAWDRELGECRPDVQHTKSCDFETSDLCEWTQDGENDFPWVRRNGWTSFEKLEYGPKHDHTSGKPLQGHYMVAEATNSRSTQKARLWSSVYNQSESVDACFRFYYHMYGSKIGRLRVLYKPIDVSYDDIADDPKYNLFEIANSHGNQWNEAFFEIEPTPDKFQIIFEATGSNGLINDIAIDDVALLSGGDCLQFSKSKTTEETDGIFEIQSCANRCNETESVRINGSTTVNQNGKLIEKCDCHLDCLELDTCCIDYQLKCLESESTETDITSTPLSEESSESSVLDEITTTPLIDLDENSYGTQSSSLKTTTILSTTPRPVTASTTFKTSVVTLRLTNATTPKAATIPALSANVTFTPIRISTVNLNLTTTKSISKSTPPIPTTTKSWLITNSTNSTTTKNPTSTVPSKHPIKPIKWTNVTLPTPKPVMKTTTTTIKPKNVRTIPTLAIKPTKTSSNVRIAWSLGPKPVTLKLSTRIVTTKSPKSMQSATTEKTLSARVITTSENSGIPKISIIIAICVMLSALLFAWKYFSANKWNNFNSHQIAFKSNYPTEGTDESLISRSDSFQIDFVDNKTLIDRGRNDDGDDDDGNDDDDGDDVVNENANTDGNFDNVNGFLHNGHQIGTRPKRIATKARFLKNSNRGGRICDQYSEKQYLMNGTGDDEQFDFTPQTTL